MSKYSWFVVSEKQLNTEVIKTRPTTGVQPVKIYRGEELKTLAATMGLTASKNAGRTGINISVLPESLKKFMR